MNKDVDRLLDNLFILESEGTATEADVANVGVQMVKNILYLDKISQENEWLKLRDYLGEKTKFGMATFTRLISKSIILECEKLGIKQSDDFIECFLFTFKYPKEVKKRLENDKLSAVLDDCIRNNIENKSLIKKKV